MKEPTKKSKVVVEKPPVKKQKKKKPTNQEKNRIKKQAAFLEYYRDLPVQKYAAAHAGVHENTILVWLKDGSDFCDRVALAKSQWAKSHTIRVKNAEWLLERLDPQTFGDKQKEKENNTLDKFMDRISKMIP